MIVTGCKVEDHEVGSEELVVERVVVERLTVVLFATVSGVLEEMAIIKLCIGWGLSSSPSSLSIPDMSLNSSSLLSMIGSLGSSSSRSSSDLSSPPDPSSEQLQHSHESFQKVKHSLARSVNDEYARSQIDH